MTRTRLGIGGYCLLLFLGLFFLSGCRVASNEPTGATEEILEVISSPVSPTALPATAPAATDPSANATDSPTETAINPDEATIVKQSEDPADADVEFVRAVQKNDGSWTFHVTVRHPDTGWEDYADGWDVVTAAGSILKRVETDPFTRLLLHPHETEQPFTRSQSGLLMPEGFSQVTVRAHDLVDGFGGREVVVDLNAGAGPDFEVERQ